MSRTTLLYDDDCNFCVWLIALILRHDRAGALAPAPIQSEEGRQLLGDLGEEARLRSWHAVTADGRRLSGGDAFAPVLRSVRRLAFLAPVADALPRSLRSGGYRVVADHRVALSRLVPDKAKRRARAEVDAVRSA